jgi:hypothetical protein
MSGVPEIRDESLSGPAAKRCSVTSRAIVRWRDEVQRPPYGCQANGDAFPAGEVGPGCSGIGTGG